MTSTCSVTSLVLFSLSMGTIFVFVVLFSQLHDGGIIQSCMWLEYSFMVWFICSGSYLVWYLLLTAYGVQISAVSRAVWPLRQHRAQCPLGVQPAACLNLHVPGACCNCLNSDVPAIADMILCYCPQTACRGQSLVYVPCRNAVHNRLQGLLRAHAHWGGGTHVQISLWGQCSFSHRAHICLVTALVQMTIPHSA